MKLPVSFSRKARKFFFFVHLWTGLLLGLWFALVGLTGSALAWMVELTSMEVQATFPFERSSPGAKHIPLSQAVASLKASDPNLAPRTASNLLVPTGRYPYYVGFGLANAKDPLSTVIYIVDPYSGRSHPPIRYSKLWMGKVQEWHVQLLAGVKGFIANTFFSLFGVFMLLSGLWLWWPSTAKQFKARMSLKRGHSYRRTLLDLHNVLGIYLFVVLLVTTATGVVWAVNTLTRGGVAKAIDKRAGAKESHPDKVPVGVRRLSADELLAKATAEAPGRLDMVRLPQKPEDSFQASFLTDSLGFWYTGYLWIDPYTGKLLHKEYDYQGTPGEKTIQVVQQLHLGMFGGVLTKLIYTVAGVLPTGLFITGLLMWVRRKKAEKNLQNRRAARGMGARAREGETVTS